MPRPHPVTLVALAVWICAVVLALQCGDLSARAGILPPLWTKVGMLCGFLHVGLVVAGMWYFPPGLPRIVPRLIQIVGMAGAFWSTGTLTRALYALLG